MSETSLSPGLHPMSFQGFVTGNIVKINREKLFAPVLPLEKELSPKVLGLRVRPSPGKAKMARFFGQSTAAIRVTMTGSHSIGFKKQKEREYKINFQLSSLNSLISKQIKGLKTVPINYPRQATEQDATNVLEAILNQECPERAKRIREGKLHNLVSKVAEKNSDFNLINPNFVDSDSGEYLFGSFVLVQTEKLLGSGGGTASTGGGEFSIEVKPEDGIVILSKAGGAAYELDLGKNTWTPTQVEPKNETASDDSVNPFDSVPAGEENRFSFDLDDDNEIVTNGELNVGVRTLLNNLGDNIQRLEIPPESMFAFREQLATLILEHGQHEKPCKAILVGDEFSTAVIFKPFEKTLFLQVGAAQLQANPIAVGDGKQQTYKIELASGNVILGRMPPIEGMEDIIEDVFVANK